MRIVYLAVALISLVVAMIGVVMPGLPTTEFVLISVWAAGKSSVRLQRWMMKHKTIGPIYINWQNGKVVTKRHKVMSAISMTVCFTVLFVSINHWPSIIFTGIGMLIGSAYIWSRPSEASTPPVLPEEQTPHVSTPDAAAQRENDD